MAVAIVVEEGAAGVPSRLRLQQAGFLRDVGEGAVAVVAIEDVLAVIADEEVVPAVVVVIADTAALAPSRAGESRFHGNVSEGAVAIVFEEVRDGFLSFGEAFEARAVDQEDIDPVVVIVVEEGHTAAGGFEQIFVLVFS